MEHDVPGLEIPVHECIGHILQQIFLQTFEVVLEHLLVELHRSGLQEAVLEIIEVEVDHPGVERIGRIADGEVKTPGAFNLDRRQFGDRAQQQGAFGRAVVAGPARICKGIIEKDVPKVLLQVTHSVVTDGQHLRYTQAFRTEMAGKCDECPVLVQVSPMDAYERNVTGRKPEISPPAAGR